MAEKSLTPAGKRPLAMSDEDRKRRENAARKLKYATDPEYAKRMVERAARYRLDHPAKVKECKATHYQKNKEKVNAKVDAWRDKNQGRVKAALIAYSRNNAEKIREYQKKRRSENAVAIKAKKAARYLETREDVRAKHSAYYANNAGRIKAMASAWGKAHRTRVNALGAAWRKANPDKVRGIRDRYNVKNPGVQRLGRLNRRARERNATGVVSRNIVSTLMALQKRKCACCRTSLNEAGYHLDHIHPLALGGAHDDLNMQLLCPPCNLSKHAKHPIDFMRSRGFLL